MLRIIFIVVVLLIALNSCSSTKKTENDDGTLKTEKEYEPNLDKRLQKFQGKLFDKTFNKRSSGSGSYDFASSNPMWRASLLVLQDIPLASVDYIGGVIITDWYSSGTNESIKININFISDEVAVSSFKVKAFKKICNNNNECKITESPESFTTSIKDKIISNIKQIKISDKKKS